MPRAALLGLASFLLALPAPTHPRRLAPTHTTRKQVKVFSSRDHVRALGAGEVDAVVGWSDDVLPLVQRTTNLAAAAPLSGTSMYADCWCIPSTAAGG